MSAWLIANMAPLMFVALIVTLLIGFPVAFSLAAVGIVFGLIGIELGLLQTTLFQALPDRVWGVMSNDTVMAGIWPEWLMLTGIVPLTILVTAVSGTRVPAATPVPAPPAVT